MPEPANANRSHMPYERGISHYRKMCVIFLAISILTGALLSPLIGHSLGFDLEEWSLEKAGQFLNILGSVARFFANPQAAIAAYIDNLFGPGYCPCACQWHR